jgi:Lrp/AsnC family leucine-responsive transcriptional regulator
LKVKGLPVFARFCLSNPSLASGISRKKQQAIEHLLDDIGWRILSESQQNARRPFAELRRIVGLSTPAVTEGVHKMEQTARCRRYASANSDVKLC